MNYEGNISQQLSSIAAAELSPVNLYTKKLAIQPTFNFSISKDDFYINTHGVSVTETAKSFTTQANGLFYILNKNNQPMVFSEVTINSVKFRNESAIPSNTLTYSFVGTTYNTSKTHAYDTYNVLFRSNIIGTLTISREAKYINGSNAVITPFQSIEFGATYLVKNVNMLDIQYYGQSNINKDNKVGTLDIKLTIKSFTEIGMINPVYDSMTLTVNLVNTGYVPPSLTNY